MTPMTPVIAPELIDLHPRARRSAPAGVAGDGL